MMPIWVGIIMLAMISSSSACRPRNCSLANANPARVEKNTTLIVMVPATRNELISARVLGALPNPRPMFSARLSPGSSGGRHLGEHRVVLRGHHDRVVEREDREE